MMGLGLVPMVAQLIRHTGGIGASRLPAAAATAGEDFREVERLFVAELADLFAATESVG
jgi:hypothetical protein